MKLTRPPRGLLSSARECAERFGGFLHDQRRNVAVGVLSTIGVTLVELLRPWPLRFVIDEILSPADAATQDDSDQKLLLLCCLAIVAIPTVSGFLSMIGQISIAQVGRKVTTRVRKLMCEHVQLLPLSFHHQSKTGDLLIRVMGDVNMVRDILFSGWISLLQRSLIFIGTLALMFYVSAPLAALALAPLPFLLVTMKGASGKMKSAVAKQRRKEGSAAALASELFTRIRGIKAFGAEKRSAKIFADLSRSGERAGVKATRIAAAASLKTEVLTAVGLAGVVFLGTAEVTGGRLSVGTLVLMLSYTRALYKPLRKINRDGIRLSKAAACVDRLFEVLDLPHEKGDGEFIPEKFAGEISFDEVSFAYGKNDPVLENVSFQIPAGSLCLVRGRNGSGKSTALSLLLRLYEPTSGSISVDNVESAHCDLESWRSQFSYVPQDDLLFSGTIEENLRFAVPDATATELETAMADTGLARIVQTLPDGLKTEVGEAGDQLSGGQRRLISLTRAALRQASILILDEPLESLDHTAKQDVAKAIRTIARGRTTLVVSHTATSEIEADMQIEFNIQPMVDSQA